MSVSFFFDGVWIMVLWLVLGVVDIEEWLIVLNMGVLCVYIKGINRWEGFDCVLCYDSYFRKLVSLLEFKL